MPNPVKYAEEELGVHDVWAEAQQRLADHDVAKGQYLQALRNIRLAESMLADRSAELIAEQRGIHADMKVTEFREHMKVTLSNDDAYQRVQSDLDEHKSERDSAKAEMDHHDLGVRATVARMHELAGLLDFYSAAKRSQVHTTQVQ